MDLYSLRKKKILQNSVSSPTAQYQAGEGVLWDNWLQPSLLTPPTPTLAAGSPAQGIQARPGGHGHTLYMSGEKRGGWSYVAVTVILG